MLQQSALCSYDWVCWREIYAPSQPAQVHYAGFKEVPGRPGSTLEFPPVTPNPLLALGSFISREISRLIALAHSIEYSPWVPWAWSHKEGLYHQVGLQSDGGDIKYIKNHETMATMIPGTQGFTLLCVWIWTERRLLVHGGWSSDAHHAIPSCSMSFAWRVLLACCPGNIDIHCL